jgi:Domain of unknown function (DUF1883)/TIR domain
VNFQQYDLGVRQRGEIVEIKLQGNAANVELVDSSNLSAFRAGRGHRYYGGHYARSPIRLPIPSSGHWYVVIHLGGYTGSVRSSVQMLPGALRPGPTLSGSALGAIRQAADEYSETIGEPPEAKVYDVFISHASEDKDTVVRPLARALARAGVTAWYDETELHIGDSLRQKIDAGLANCRFGVVVLSPSFFDKGWPNYELDGLVTREVSSGQQLILPIWHRVSHADVVRYSPTLAGKLARQTAITPLDDIATEIAEVTGAALTPE